MCQDQLPLNGLFAFMCPICFQLYGLVIIEESEWNKFMISTAEMGAADSAEWLLNSPGISLSHHGKVKGTDNFYDFHSRRSD